MLKKTGLITGLILFLYVTTHLLNHTLGLISLEAMEAGRDIFLLIWRNPLGTLIIYGSILIHFALAIWALFRRRSLSMTFSEAAQLTFGISIRLLLAMHVMGTRVAHEIAGTTDNYAYVLLVHWKFSNKYIVYQHILNRYPRFQHILKHVHVFGQNSEFVRKSVFANMSIIQFFKKS